MSGKKKAEPLTEWEIRDEERRRFIDLIKKYEYSSYGGVMTVLSWRLLDDLKTFKQ